MRKPFITTCYCMFLLLSFNAAKGFTQERHYKLMFYNVENLFDTYDDSLTADNDFTPAGRLHWTKSRYSDKLNNISKVIIAAGEWQPPAIIGLCEIENRRVLNELVNNTALSKFPYKIIHDDSPDERGIDVALLFDSRKVRIAQHRSIPVTGHGLVTRDILYSLAIIQTDTLHLFVNHWPSRSAGQLETEHYRMLAANLLRHVVDSIFIANPSAKIVITGDFNDDPTDDSLVKGLGTKIPDGKYSKGTLYNLSMAAKGPVKGTLKYQGNWNIFDQVIVSGGMLDDIKSLHADKNSYRIFYKSMMLENDETYNGLKPFRTYLGFRYHGGFSDHLPVILEIY